MTVAAFQADANPATSLRIKGPHPYIDVTHRYYGAKFDNVQDDTDRIQAAFDDATAQANGSGPLRGATVILPGGIAKITSQLHLNQPTVSTAGSVSVEGAGLGVTRFSTNVPGEAALLVEGDKYFRLSGFGLVNAVGSRGTTVGIEFSADPANPGSGTMTNGALIDHISANSYATGVQLGRGNYACSELAFRGLNVSSCDVGIQGGPQNTLNFLFDMLVMGACTIGLDGGSAGSFIVNGGSASGNGTDFKVYNGSTLNITGFRSEVASNRFVWVPSTSVAPVSVVLDDCHVAGGIAADGGCIEMSLCAGLTILGGVYTGKIFVKGNTTTPSGSVQMLGTYINGTAPFEAKSAGDLNGITALVVGCKQLTGAFVTASFDNFCETYGASDAVLGGWRVKQNGNISWNGATPVAKPTFAANATDLATAITLVNDLKARLVAYGLGA